MSISSLTDSQIQALSDCITHGRMGQGIIYASAILYWYDYSLTVWDEAKYVWLPRRTHASSIAFMVARYGAMASAIISIVPNASAHNTNLVLRLISIAASEFIVAVRTWAIWGKSHRILIILAVLSVAAIIPAAVVVGQSIVSSQVVALVSPAFVDICSLTTSNIKQGYVVPYILTILYEFVTLTLSLIQILKWRKTIPKDIRAPIIDILWKDGVLYFSFMMVLGFVNIGLVLQQGVPQIRSGGAELQTVIHSVLSTRIVLHLAKSKDSRDITAPGVSVFLEQSRTTGIQFTNEFATIDQN